MFGFQLFASSLNSIYKEYIWTYIHCASCEQCLDLLMFWSFLVPFFNIYSSTSFLLLKHLTHFIQLLNFQMISNPKGDGGIALYYYLMVLGNQYFWQLTIGYWCVCVYKIFRIKNWTCNLLMPIVTTWWSWHHFLHLSTPNVNVNCQWKTMLAVKWQLGLL